MYHQFLLERVDTGEQIGLNNQPYQSAKSSPQIQNDEATDNLQDLQHHGDACQHQPWSQETRATLVW